VSIRRRWPWLVALAAGVFYGLALLPWPGTGTWTGPSTDLENLFFAIVVGVAIIALAGVGALLIERVPSNVIGYLLLVAGGLMGLGSVIGRYALDGSLVEPEPWPGVAAAQAVAGPLWVVSLMIVVLFVPLVFPTGHLLGPRWRWVVSLGIATLAVTSAGMALGLDGQEGLIGALQASAAMSLVVCLGASVVAIVLRFRRGDRVVRQQLKWFSAIVGLSALDFAAMYGGSWVLPIGLRPEEVEVVGSVFWNLGIISFALVPIAIGVAVLRYRLYEIDRIISRTIGWAIVTGVLVGTFAVLVLGLQTVLEPFTGGNTLVIAGSTLVVAALFQPLRTRVQRAVDRRFDRGRYDAERLLEALGDRLLDEVDLSAISADVLATVDAAVRPSSAGLWLREREGGGA
jgi:hypothetical protein